MKLHGASPWHLFRHAAESGGRNEREAPRGQARSHWRLNPGISLLKFFRELRTEPLVFDRVVELLRHLRVKAFESLVLGQRLSLIIDSVISEREVEVDLRQVRS